MSTFDPDFAHFREASGYRNRRTDHESKFQAFRDFVVSNKAPSGFSSPFVIQLVCHPNFEAHRKTVSFYELSDEGDRFDQIDALPGGYLRANSFKNYKSNSGHPRGLFYELNLYTKDGISHHHTSRVSGSTYERDSSHDQKPGTSKGKHWLE